MISTTGETSIEHLLAAYDDSTPGSFPTDFAEVEPEEFVVEKNGTVRQAGALPYYQEFIDEFRKAAEVDLFVFSKVVMKRKLLTRRLHYPVARWLMDRRFQYKQLLMPRDHFKTTIVSQSLPIHIHIQPKESNIYYPGMLGRNIRIMLACETEGRASGRLRWIKENWESNELLRRLWPDARWESPSRQASKWSETEIIIPREESYPEPSMQAIGVGGTITGAHQECHIKDDLISIDAKNSVTVMQTAIDWHEASRALMDRGEVESDYRPLEFMVGTRWAVFDLYHHIQITDPKVSVLKMSITKNDKEIYPEGYEDIFEHINYGELILPERFTLDDLDDLKRTHGDMFFLLYNNDAVDSALVAFSEDRLRPFALVGDEIVFDEDERDEAIEARLGLPSEEVEERPEWMPLNRDTYPMIFPHGGRDEFLKERYAGRGA